MDDMFAYLTTLPHAPCPLPHTCCPPPCPALPPVSVFAHHATPPRRWRLPAHTHTCSSGSAPRILAGQRQVRQNTLADITARRHYFIDLKQQRAFHDIRVYFIFFRLHFNADHAHFTRYRRYASFGHWFSRRDYRRYIWLALFRANYGGISRDKMNILMRFRFILTHYRITRASFFAAIFASRLPRSPRFRALLTPATWFWVLYFYYAPPISFACQLRRWRLGISDTRPPRRLSRAYRCRWNTPSASPRHFAAEWALLKMPLSLEYNAATAVSPQ